MLTDREQKLVNWLRMREVATMRHLLHQFQVCHMTVFRALKKDGYHTSYNHNAGYYTLAVVPRFDDWGLWAYRDVRFSRAGTLLETLVALVTQAPAGLTVSELEDRLQRPVATLLSRLVQHGQLQRHVVQGRHVRGPGQLSLPLRPARDVKVADVAVLELFRSPYAPGEEKPLVPRRHLRFTPGKDVPLPGGVIEVGARRADGTWAPLGEDPTPRVPAGREADVALGALPDVVVFYRLPELNVLPQGTFQREAVVQFELENRRKQQTRLELRHELGSPYELLETDPEPRTRRPDEARHPPHVRADAGHLHLWHHVRDPQHRGRQHGG